MSRLDSMGEIIFVCALCRWKLSGSFFCIQNFNNAHSLSCGSCLCHKAAGRVHVPLQPSTLPPTQPNKRPTGWQKRTRSLREIGSEKRFLLNSDAVTDAVTDAATAVLRSGQAGPSTQVQPGPEASPGRNSLPETAESPNYGRTGPPLDSASAGQSIIHPEALAPQNLLPSPILHRTISPALFIEQPPGATLPTHDLHQVCYLICLQIC